MSFAEDTTAQDNSKRTRSLVLLLGECPVQAWHRGITLEIRLHAAGELGLQLWLRSRGHLGVSMEGRDVLSSLAIWGLEWDTASTPAKFYRWPKPLARACSPTDTPQRNMKRAAYPSGSQVELVVYQDPHHPGPSDFPPIKELFLFGTGRSHKRSNRKIGRAHV